MFYFTELKARVGEGGERRLRGARENHRQERDERGGVCRRVGGVREPGRELVD
jgi:hypothetical protein